MRLHSDSSFAVRPRVEEELAELQSSVSAFTALQDHEAEPIQRYHQVLGEVHRLCAAIARCKV